MECWPRMISFIVLTAPWGGYYYSFLNTGASLLAQTVKNLPAMQETQVRSLGWKAPLEEEMAPPVFLPGEFHGQSSLAGYSPWGRKESDMTEWLSTAQHISVHSCVLVIVNNAAMNIGLRVCFQVWGRMDTCICMSESLCCLPETIMILLSTQYKIKIKNKRVYLDFLIPK